MYVSATLTASDFVAGYRLHIRKKILNWRMTAWFVLVFTPVFMAVIQQNTPDRSNLAISLVSGLACGLAASLVSVILYLTVYAPWMGHRTFKINRLLHDTFQLDADTDSLQVSSPNFYFKCRWTDYTPWQENHLVILLYRIRYIFQIVPKRVLSSQDVEEIRGCARDVVGCRPSPGQGQGGMANSERDQLRSVL